MHALHVSPWYPPEVLGGVETFLIGLSQRLVELGVRTSVFCYSSEVPVGTVAENSYMGCQVYRFGMAAGDLWTWHRLPHVVTAARDVASKARPDVVHFHPNPVMPRWLAHTLRRDGFPIVTTRHAAFATQCARYGLTMPDGSKCDGYDNALTCLLCARGHMRNPLGTVAARMMAPFALLALEILERLRGIVPGVRHYQALDLMRFVRGVSAVHDYLRVSTIVVAPSRFIADHYRGAGYDVPYRIIGHGCDFGHLRGVVRKPSPVVRFGYVGRLSSEKGVHVAIEALRRRPDLRAKLLIFGPGYDSRYSARLHELANGDPRISLQGPVPPECIAQAYSQFDVVVLPTVYPESWSMTVREAFASGAPVIASSIGALPEVIGHEVNGILVEAGDPEALASALARLSEDADLLKRLKAGIPPVKSFTENASEYLSVYSEAIARASTAGERLSLAENNE